MITGFQLPTIRPLGDGSIKRRTRDLEVLALCEYVEGERVNAAPFRRPGDAVNAPPLTLPSRPPPQRYGRYMRKRRPALKALRGK